jgi:hypothetical protein
LLEGQILTVLVFIGALVTFYGCGYGVVRLLLPKSHLTDLFCVAPSVGAAAHCWIAFLISGLFRIPVTWTVWIATITLLGVTVAVVLRRRPVEDRQAQWKSLYKSIAVSIPIVVIVLWPMFLVGADTYLGTVNPDFLFALKDSHFVKTRYSTAVGPDRDLDSYRQFETAAQVQSVHARYIGNLHGVLIEQLFRQPPRTALTVALGLWIFLYPQAIYYATKHLFGLTGRIAFVAALLAGISGPIAMSYITFFVGQNSSLSITPLLMTMVFLLFCEPSLRLFGLTVLLFCSQFWIYPTQLPFVVLPAISLALFKVVTRRMSFMIPLGIGAGIAVLFAVLHAGFGRFWPIYVSKWVQLAGNIERETVFLEFLTEAFLPMLLGLMTYSPSASVWHDLFPHFAYRVANGVALVLVAGLAVVIVRWARRAASFERVIFAGIVWLIVVFAWWWNTFVLRYGYALLKMSTWGQVAILPFVALGLVWLWEWARSGRRFAVLRYALFAGVTVLWCGSNVVTTVDYGVKSLGKPSPRSGIVNLFGITGNRDYLTLEQKVRSYISKDQTVAMSFSDSVQTEWATYYLRNQPTSILSHARLPFMEEHARDLEGVETEWDFEGRWVKSPNPYYHGAQDHFYLLPVVGSWTRDIVPAPIGRPLWRDGTFEFYRAAEVHDLLVTARGYYRLDRVPSPDYWWPNPFRWTSQGGELILLRPAAKQKEYRLSMVAIAGYGDKSTKRTIEFYHGGKKFSEAVIDGCARIVTGPFVPTADVERLYFRVKEQVPPLRRTFGMWNRHIPADYRGLNVAVGEVQILAGHRPDKAIALNEPVSGLRILERAHSFDGVEVNGWVRRRAEFSFLRSEGSRNVTIDFFIPGYRDYHFPYEMMIEVDGRSQAFRALKPGKQQVRIPLAPASSSEVCRIRLEPSQWYRPEGYQQALRGVEHSILLESVRFGQEEVEVKPPDAKPSREVDGPDLDGWVRRPVTIRLVGRRAQSVELDIEVPGWSGLKSQELTVSRGNTTVLQREFTPGFHTVKIPPISGVRALTVQGTHSFSLPKPDARTVFYRIIAVRRGGIAIR